MLEASVMHVQRNRTRNKNMQRGTCIMGSRTYIIQQVYIYNIVTYLCERSTGIGFIVIM